MVYATQLERRNSWSNFKWPIRIGAMQGATTGVDPGVTMGGEHARFARADCDSKAEARIDHRSSNDPMRMQDGPGACKMTWQSVWDLAKLVHQANGSAKTAQTVKEEKEPRVPGKFANESCRPRLPSLLESEEGIHRRGLISLHLVGRSPIHCESTHKHAKNQTQTLAAVATFWVPDHSKNQTARGSNVNKHI